jgi:predicted permease
MSLFNRIFQRRDLYNELSEEMRQHLEERTDQLIREGMPRKEAEQAARRAFGNATLVEQRSREVWQWPTLESLLRDLSFSARLLRRSPGFTLVAVLTLTLGIGANTAIFSLLNGLLLRPISVPQADRLVVLHMPAGEFGYSFCAPILRGLELHHDAFRDLFGFAATSVQVREKDGNHLLTGEYVTGEYFNALRTAPELGRTLTPGDDSKDYSSGSYAAVISDGFWKTHYNRSSDAIGQKLIVSNVPFTVVGVMPHNFFGFDVNSRPEIWIPLITEPLVDAPYDMLDGGYGMWWLRIGARLQPGVSVSQANSWLRSAVPSMVKQAIPDPRRTFEGIGRNDLSIVAEPGSTGYSFVRRFYRRPLLLIFAFCAALLLLACVNLASLLLARAAVRRREIATRLAIGASRRRIIQQLLIDSLLLSFLGAAAGFSVAPLASHALILMITMGSSTIYLDAHIDWRVCLFVAAVAIASTVLVGLLPALQATSGDLNQRLKDGAQSTRRERRRILPRFLLVFEVALAMVLVSGAGLLSASLFRLYHSGFGFDPHNILLVRADTSKQPVEGAARQRLYHDLRDRFAALPGVRAVAYASVAPLSGNRWQGATHVPGGQDRDVSLNTVSTGYLSTLNIPLLAGRDFNEQDSSAKEIRVLINRSAARMFFPQGDAVGRLLGDPYHGPKVANNRIIGIVGDTKYQKLRDPDPPMVYSVVGSDSNLKKPSYEFILRVSGPIAPLASAIRNILAQLAPDVPAPTLMTMERQIDEDNTADRMMTLLSAFFALSALLVTAIGLYGVLAWSTARRTSEIGIRMALGAGRTQVVALIFRENLWLAIAGAGVGFAAAILASRALASFLYGTSPRDPWILSASLAVLCLVSAIASLIPALRAASIDPMQALRTE